MAATILVVFLTSLFALNSTVMRMLRSAHETAAASQELQTRVEQLRLANWRLVTTPSWVQANLLPTSAQAGPTHPLVRKTDTLNDLPGLSEEIVCTGQGTLVPAPSYTVSRDADGKATCPDDGVSTSLAAQDQMLVRVTVTWRSWGGRARTRELQTVLSRWGISK